MREPRHHGFAKAITIKKLETWVPPKTRFYNLLYQYCGNLRRIPSPEGRDVMGPWWVFFMSQGLDQSVMEYRCASWVYSVITWLVDMRDGHKCKRSTYSYILNVTYPGILIGPLQPTCVRPTWALDSCRVRWFSPLVTRRRLKVISLWTQWLDPGFWPIPQMPMVQWVLVQQVWSCTGVFWNGVL